MSKSKKEPPKKAHIIYIPDHEPESLNQDCKICPIPITSIVDVEETQIREAYNQQVIDDLKLLFKEDDQDNESKDYSVYLDPKNHKEIEECYPLCLPPIIVARCPDDIEKFWILDGHHRYQAAVESGRTWISAQIINHTYFKIKNIDDLRFLQARENTDAVANRTNETKRRQVRAARLKSDWNANQIARYCHVSWNLVVDVIQEDSSSGKYERKGAPADKVQEAIDKPENASKSNRELAKELNVSEGTVRNVRKNQKKEKYAPDAVNSAEQTGDCIGCGILTFTPYVVTSQNGERLRFCSESCAEEYACREGLFFDADTARFFDNEEDFRNADALDKVSQKANTWLDDHAPQQRPSLAKVTAETRRVVPDVEKPKSKVIKSGSIPLKDVDNIQQIVDDVCDWLGDRVAAFAVLFQDKRNRTED